MWREIEYWKWGHDLLTNKVWHKEDQIVYVLRTYGRVLGVSICVFYE